MLVADKQKELVDLAAYSVASKKHATLVATTVDQVTLTQGFSHIEVIERGGTVPLWVTYGPSPADPTSAGDDVLFVPPNGKVTIDGNERGNMVVKVLGNGNAYSVQGVDE